MKRELILNIDGEEVTVTAVRDGESIHVEREGTAYSVRVVAESIVGVTAMVQSPTGSAPAGVSGAPSRATPTGASATSSRPAAAAATTASSVRGNTGIGQVVAPMTGVIDQVVASEGAVVAEGDVVVILEAMKMYIDVVAPTDGTVRSIAVQPGDQVREGSPLLTIE